MILVAALLPAPFTASAQGPSPPVTKTNSIKDVRVSALPGWFEFVSEKYRFRVLFPGEPQTDGDVASMKGFKVKDASGQWAAWCSDLGRTVPNESSALRSAYQQAIGAMTHDRNSLFISGDVFLYGRLGTEMVIHTSGRISYIRAFIFGRRLYTLSVTRKRTDQGRDAIPPDVRQFFDSFAYWD